MRCNRPTLNLVSKTLKGCCAFALGIPRTRAEHDSEQSLDVPCSPVTEVPVLCQTSLAPGRPNSTAWPCWPPKCARASGPAPRARISRTCIREDSDTVCSNWFSVPNVAALPQRRLKARDQAAKLPVDRAGGQGQASGRRVRAEPGRELPVSVCALHAAFLWVVAGRGSLCTCVMSCAPAQGLPSIR